MVKLIPKIFFYWYYVAGVTDAIKRIEPGGLGGVRKGPFQAAVGHPV
jgi:hypothetical protein